ncbi:Uncharacterized protein C24B11.05 [Triticum urartu]|uniref:Uncharacterized protein C24B11.05 n=1 Tax=Triticum urartu TaxID=4572 RepID=M7YYI3_TRIUA|nr:Uncharacterized protein C24B11.05 [Triticum urartu]
MAGRSDASAQSARRRWVPDEEDRLLEWLCHWSLTEAETKARRLRRIKAKQIRLDMKVAKLKGKQDRVIRRLQSYIVVSDSYSDNGSDGSNVDPPPTADSYSCIDDQKAKSRRGSGQGCSKDGGGDDDGSDYTNIYRLLGISFHRTAVRIMEFDERCLKVQDPKFDCLLFDLDDTLYPLSSGISSHVKTNIEAYMVEKLGIEESKIENLGNLLYKNYGTTMAGLRAIGYNFDYDEYHSFVHGRLPYDNIKPDPVLKQILKNMRMRKLIFTNGDMIHAVRALKRLGLEDCFEGIICFETLNPPCLLTPCDQAPEIFDIAGHFAGLGSADDLPRTPVLCKPNVGAMEAALRIANVNPYKAIFFDDSVRNIQAGKRIGLHTVLVGTSQRVKGADHALESIHNIREALPGLWGEAEKAEDVLYADRVAIETSPNVGAMEAALRIANVNPYKAIFFDDSVRNIQAGKRIGLHTVLVGTSQRVKGADHALESIHNIREARRELWEEAEKAEDVLYADRVAIETSVTA